MRVTALSTAGVLEKNDTTGNYTAMYVSQYFVSYKREGDSRWRHYHRNDVSVTVRILSSTPLTFSLHTSVWALLKTSHQAPTF